MQNGLMFNSDRLHTTKLGAERIKRNLNLEADDIILWCKGVICSPDCCITRKGKNWYACLNGCIITVNAHSYTVITAHKVKR